MGRRGVSGIAVACALAMVLAGCAPTMGALGRTVVVLLGPLVVLLVVAAMELTDAARSLLAKTRSRAAGLRDLATVTALVRGAGHMYGPLGRRPAPSSLDTDLRLACARIGAAGRLVDSDEGGRR